jgi:hypothetical protein
MADKWRFDPNEDYTSDEKDYGNSRSNFQRFPKKKSNKSRSNKNDDFDGNKRKNRWR